MSDQQPHEDPGEEGPNPWIKSLMVWGGIFLALLLLVSALATVAAPFLIGLYSTNSWSEQDVDAAVLFARFCLPQILFYGLFTMFSQVLNARGKFAAPMFAPIVNNVVVIATAVIFIVVVLVMVSVLIILVVIVVVGVTRSWCPVSGSSNRRTRGRSCVRADRPRPSATTSRVMRTAAP